MRQAQAAPAGKGCEGFILAGGASSRFGSEKSLATFDGEPLLARAIRLLASVASPVRIAGARTQFLGDFAAVVPDLSPNRGPLGGILAGLQAASSAFSLFLPVDMPLIPPELLHALVRRSALTQAPVTCLRLYGQLEPFPAVVHRSLLPRVADALATHASCQRLWQSLPDLDSPAVESLLQAGQLPRLPIPPSLWWRSVNTPGDHAFLAACHARAFCSSRLIP